jgi:hypothetical protein
MFAIVSSLGGAITTSPARGATNMKDPSMSVLRDHFRPHAICQAGVCRVAKYMVQALYMATLSIRAANTGDNLAGAEWLPFSQQLLLFDDGKTFSGLSGLGNHFND